MNTVALHYIVNLVFKHYLLLKLTGLTYKVPDYISQQSEITHDMIGETIVGKNIPSPEES